MRRWRHLLAKGSATGGLRLMYSRLDMKGIRGPMCRNVYQKPRGWLPVDKTFAGDQRFKLSTVFPTQKAPQTPAVR